MVKKSWITQALEQILQNQKNIMIWIGNDPFYEGYFKENIANTEELLE